MNQDRLMKQGLLAQRQEEMSAETTRIERLVKDINLNLFMADGPEDIGLDAAEQAFKELSESLARWRAARAQVRKLRGELGL